MFCVIFHALFGNMFFTVLPTVVHPCHLSISHNSSMAAITLICDATGGKLNGHDEKVRLFGLGSGCVFLLRLGHLVGTTVGRFNIFAYLYNLFCIFSVGTNLTMEPSCH